MRSHLETAIKAVSPCASAMLPRHLPSMRSPYVPPDVTFVEDLESIDCSTTLLPKRSCEASLKVSKIPRKTLFSDHQNHYQNLKKCITTENPIIRHSVLHVYRSPERQAAGAIGRQDGPAHCEGPQGVRPSEQ